MSEYADVTLMAYDDEGNCLDSTGWDDALARVEAELCGEATGNPHWAREKARRVLNAVFGGGWGSLARDFNPEAE